MDTLVWKRRLGKWCASYIANRKVILLYHTVGQSAWALPHKQFDDQMRWLADHCEVLTVSELIHAKSTQHIQVALTFDDGYVSLYEAVLENLLAKNMKATVYVNTGWIAEKKEHHRASVASLGHYPEEYFLNWHEVSMLHQAGWEIGSHGVEHCNVAQLTPEDMHRELAHSKVAIEAHLKKPCVHFAYPWGRYSRRVKNMLNKIGYRYAAAAYHAPLAKTVDCLAIPRLNIDRAYRLQDFIDVLLGKWDYLRWIHRARGL